MGCIGCSTASADGGKPSGCNSNGSCSSGGCNRMNTYDWLAAMDIHDVPDFQTVEVTFKNGTRKEFFKNPPHSRAATSDWVVVESDGGGYDVGKISLSGDLVRLQMKKKGVREDISIPSVIRKANERDLERMQEARSYEKATMIQARAIAQMLNLDMKVGDVEYQADIRKATFFYIADGRVDFRELIRHYAKEFRVKVEMRQIGARQESARVGGIGSCGRELCCSTWLTDFKSVSTTAARYQNLAINQAKLSGQCGRLKCCLNYELDVYVEALDKLPQHAEKLDTLTGRVSLAKTDIFKGLLYYAYEGDKSGKLYVLTPQQVKDIQKQNSKGVKAAALGDMVSVLEIEKEVDAGYDDVTGAVELPPDAQRKRKRKNKNKNRPNQEGGENRNRPARDEPRPNNEGGSNRPERQARPEPRRDDRAPNPNRPHREAEGGSPNPRPPKNQQQQQQQRPPQENRPPREPRPEQENRPQQQRPPREQQQERPKDEVKNTPNAVEGSEQVKTDKKPFHKHKNNKFKKPFNPNNNQGGNTPPPQT